MDNTKLRYKGRVGQTFLYFIKIARIFVFRNDWKVLPMAAVIAGLVSMVVGKGLFQTMEGTLQGTFALACVCIWNGFFNSIQVICRERPVIKREHRAGLHMSSYVCAHLLFQMLLCAVQSVITIVVCRFAGVYFPGSGIIVPGSRGFYAEFFITLFLITYAADVLALMISAIVHTTTTAMTVMPFMLIVQLVFAGYFSIPDSLKDVTDMMISKWGIQGLCCLGHYNDLPAVLIWNRMMAAGNVDLGGIMSLSELMEQVEKMGMRDRVLSELGKASQNVSYVSTPENLLLCWGYLLCFAVIFAFITVVFLEFIDRDKR
ncbi:MAG: ABC transporter permease [Lachnospiraceae bacterium]|nr:ABC transporter permease [Lachnospiraceae bacterium]